MSVNTLFRMIWKQIYDKKSSFSHVYIKKSCLLKFEQPKDYFLYLSSLKLRVKFHIIPEITSHGLSVVKSETKISGYF